MRLETIAEDLVRGGVDAAGYANAFRAALGAAMTTSVGCKSVIAYRIGLAFDPTPPTEPEVAGAAGAWLRAIETTGIGAADRPGPAAVRALGGCPDRPAAADARRLRGHRPGPVSGGPGTHDRLPAGDRGMSAR